MKTESFRIGDWVCRPRLHRLSSEDREVQVEPKVMQVLVCLASRPGELLSRRELLDSVWADTVVSEQVLSRAISELRKVFGDDSRTPTVITPRPAFGPGRARIQPRGQQLKPGGRRRVR